MQIVLADLASADGFVSKDTVAGGYGSRLRPFSRVTQHHLGGQASFSHASERSARLHRGAVRRGRPRRHLHRRRGGRRRRGDRADVARRLSSRMRMGRGSARARRRVGFVGLTASKLPELFDASGDFVIIGEPEHAIMRLAAGEVLAGRVPSTPIDDLTTAAVPAVGSRRRRSASRLASTLHRPAGRRIVSAARQPRLSRNSAPTARIAFWRRIALGRSRTSSTNSNICAR